MSRFLTASAAALLACSAASADFIGWTASVRSVPNGYLVNVFAVTDNAGDELLNRYGGNAGPSSGFITTNAVGGFRQGGGNQALFAPADQQSWSTLDSFLTVGGELTPQGEWMADSATVGDPDWSVAYVNSNTGMPATANAFVTPSNAVGFTNPYLNSIPAPAGWFIVGVAAPARSLASIGCRVASSSAAVAAASQGMLVAQLYITDTTPGRQIAWRMAASMRRPDHSISQGVFEFVIPVNADSDGDGVVDCIDQCPNLAGPAECNGCPANVCGGCGTPVDSDGDGVPDCIDNCPRVPNPDQTDSNGDGFGDACQPFDDCNANGIDDAEEIATGQVPDCNGDGIPDSCQGALLVAETSGNLGAPSGQEARSYAFGGLPFAESAAQLTIDVRGDLNGLTEFIDVSLNGTTPRRFFQTNGNSCPAVPDRAVITLTAAEFNALLGNAGTLQVTMTCPITVDPTECKGAELTEFSLAYVGIDSATGDCNGNHRLDICETHDGSTPDCNGNGVPDSCDIAMGTALDCNGNGVPDSCEIAENPGLDCNSNGIPDSCDIATGTSADIDSNGTPDECQTVHVPGDYSTIQSAINAAPTNLMRIIAVAPGTYAGPINFLGKPVIVRGAGAASTVIQGTSGQSLSVVRFSGGEPAIAALEGVSVRAGASGTPFPGSPSTLVGGGIFSYESAASMRNCVVESNTAGFGGGAYFFHSSGSIVNCIFRSNIASSDGGGFQANQSTVHMTDVLVELNQCNSRGGGVHLVQGQPNLTRVIVRNNYSNSLIGGLSWYALGEPTAFMALVNCSVTGNNALVTQGGIGISSNGLAAPAASLVGTTACTNSPRPNVSGAWTDLGGNTICDCLGDLTFDGFVNGADLGLLLGAWGTPGGTTGADLNRDGIVNGADLGLLLGAWGPCPN